MDKKGDREGIWIKIIVALVIAAMALSLLMYGKKAQADDGMYFGVSMNKYQQPAEYNWWYPFYSSDIEMKSESVRIGYDQAISQYMTFRVGYDGHGKHSIEAHATPDEYQMMTGQCDPYSTCRPADLYKTSGRIQTLEFGVQLHGPWKYTPFIYGGYTLLRHDFKVAAISMGTGSQYGNTPGDSFTHQEHLYGVGKAFGAGFVLGRMTIGWYIYKSPVADKFKKDIYCLPSGVDSVKTIAIDYRIEFRT